MEIAWRTSFHGRTKRGYASWSLDGHNAARLNLNCLWEDAVRIVEAHVARSLDPTSWTPRELRAAREAVFVLLAAVTAGHEVLHLALHQVLEIRRARGRASEADVHHAGIVLVDELLLS